MGERVVIEGCCLKNGTIRYEPDEGAGHLFTELGDEEAPVFRLYVPLIDNCRG